MRRQHRLALALAILLWVLASSALPGIQDGHEEQFFQKYLGLAILNRSSHPQKPIPIAITLAQAYLESNSGRSELAREANNFFGLKCQPKDTCADAYLLQDDEYDSKGEGIASRFMRFDSPEASFAAHAERLRSQSNYAPLFKLDPKDYRAWSQGLQQCGYASDPEYPQKLIRIIETHSLYRYDEMEEADIIDMLAGAKPIFPSGTQKPNIVEEPGEARGPGSPSTNTAQGRELPSAGTQGTDEARSNTYAPSPGGTMKATEDHKPSFARRPL